MEKKSTSENRFKLIEIVIAIIGGLFTFYLFLLKDVPNLNKALVGTDILQIDTIKNRSYSKHNDSCLLTYSISLKNVGYNNVYIDSISTGVKLVNPDIKEYSGYIFMDGVETGDNEYMNWSNQLIGYYPPGIKRTENFYYVVPVEKDTGVLIRYEAYGHGTKWFFFHSTFITSGYAFKLQCIPFKEVKHKERDEEDEKPDQDK
ncbi:MAG TPA: hypothetical protein VGN20_15360 [Mucilaginibacter sp.]|jgi:hypothetical protein